MSLMEFYGLAFLIVGITGAIFLAIVAPVIVWRTIADGCFMGLQSSKVYEGEQTRVRLTKPQAPHDEKH